MKTNTLITNLVRDYSPYFGNGPICKVTKINKVLRDNSKAYTISKQKPRRIPGVPSKFDIILEQEKRKLLV